MSGLSVVTEVVKWVGHTIKTAEVGVSIYDSVQASKDAHLSTGEKVAIITTNSVFGALQLADVGMSVHSTVSNYTRPNSPIEVRKIGSRTEKSESSSERPSRPAPDPNSIDPEGRVIAGYRRAGSTDLPDRAIQDSQRPLKNRTQHNVSAEQIRRHRASESKNYSHLRMAVKGATGLADLGRHVVKKICKVRRLGLDVHDYFDILGIICSRTGDCVGFTLEAYPKECLAHEPKIKLASDILSICPVVFRNTRRLEEFGKMIKERIHGKSSTEPKSPQDPDPSNPQSQPNQENTPNVQAESIEGPKPSPAADSLDSQPHQENAPNVQAEIEEGSESGPAPGSSDPQPQINLENPPISQNDQSIQVEIGEGSGSASIDSPDLEAEIDSEKLSDLQLGKLMWNEIEEALSIKDILQINRIPKLIREDIVLKNYSCGISGEPIRFIVMVQADIKSLPVYYEKEVLETWFQRNPEKKPPQWPEGFLPCNWSEVEKFNKDNYVVNSIQKKIDKRLAIVLDDLRTYDLSIPQKT